MPALRGEMLAILRIASSHRGPDRRELAFFEPEADNDVGVQFAIDRSVRNVGGRSRIATSMRALLSGLDRRSDISGLRGAGARRRYVVRAVAIRCASHGAIEYFPVSTDK